MHLTRDEIVRWLRETDEARLADLWQAADNTRQQNVGGDVHLRGLIELSNYCIRLCAYCGLRAPNQGVTRYRMTGEEVMDCARQAVAFGYGTVVLQSGEDPGIGGDWMADLIRRMKSLSQNRVGRRGQAHFAPKTPQNEPVPGDFGIGSKSETSLAVTLSLGERSDEDLVRWREAGADRYLLRFETSNPALYERIHPPRPGTQSDRLSILRRLRGLGFEVGSGVMIGIPGQSYDDLAKDIELFGELDLDMIGVGPYLMHPDTPLGDPEFCPLLPADDQVPSNELMTYKVISLARLVCPKANIPSTTALATVNQRNGRELGLVRGANVVMPNLTPPKYRVHYEIYPNKACIRETADGCHTCLQARIASLGREVGAGRGDSPNRLRRTDDTVEKY
ncbi:MAG: [FeFe] hydrogenase H-cluster radical SAM maturase HydE [Rhodopirellula sp.]|nr:[FeFe] hydrogenase H-cluster radical SAM maturase HydE [Rhodopirellula sp.]